MIKTVSISSQHGGECLSSQHLEAIAAEFLNMRSAWSTQPSATTEKPCLETLPPPKDSISKHLNGVTFPTAIMIKATAVIQTTLPFCMCLGPCRFPLPAPVQKKKKN